MNRITTLSHINYNVPEGRLLMAALAKLTVESQRDKTPDEVIWQCNELSDHMFKDDTTYLYNESTDESNISPSSY